MKIKRALAGMAVAVAVMVPAIQEWDHVNTAQAQVSTSPEASWTYYYAELHYRIIGTGSYVNYFLREITNEDWPGTLYTSSRMCGPGGCSSWILYGTTLQNTTNASYGENRDLPSGRYCAQFDLYGKPITQACYSVS